MTAWSGIEAIAAREMANFLAGTLPRHGGPGYWTAYVLGPLQNSAKPNPAEGIEEGDFHAFDLHALLKIVRGCGPELVLHGLLPAGADKQVKGGHRGEEPQRACAGLRSIGGRAAKRRASLMRRLLEDIGADNDFPCRT